MMILTMVCYGKKVDEKEKGEGREGRGGGGEAADVSAENTNSSESL